ncbi:amidohydrolase family protein [Chitinophaga nivalis]|uniref:Amidohydrolase family protein n=1 Tax=Chitinophaga nivalis TaxID=2991709 RepID=A0ABT3IQ97_9BACT|nr:amidohydrolase family protein [Chitinophaga nivalis]MCW3464172.1 amidohydrolase family protein [Chitinophaga nivalis]MCW3486138.1 amidohydrolase family protein [Chitinophaga nivalis]
MKKHVFIYTIALVLNSLATMAQEATLPAPPQDKPIYLTNATIHVGNGQVIPNGSIAFQQGKITAIGTGIAAPPGATIRDLGGQHLYPGLIAPATQVGLVEVDRERPTMDYRETGPYNPSVRAVVAYNTDSRIINTLRSNGVLLAHIVPQGELFAGTSAVMQLDAWDWQDAAYKAEAGQHFYIPRPYPGMPAAAVLEQLEEARTFLREAKAYLSSQQHSVVNLKFEALQSLFKKEQPLFVHATLVQEMMLAVGLAKEFDISVVIVGGADAWMIADLLKQQQIAVILQPAHSLPLTADDPIDQPYKTAGQLQRAGVLFAISDNGYWRQRNLMFQAGTASAYGLSKEEALSAITLNAAKILGIAHQTGSLETGKDANIVVSKGDLLDMRSNQVTLAFIQGREIDLNDKHKMLYEKYKTKYGITR